MAQLNTDKPREIWQVIWCPSRDSSVRIVTMPWAEQQRNLGSVPGWGLRFSSSQKRRNRTWVGNILLFNRHQGVFFSAGSYAAGAVPHMPSWRAESKLLLYFYPAEIRTLHFPSTSHRYAPSQANFFGYQGSRSRCSFLQNFILPNTSSIRPQQI